MKFPAEQFEELKTWIEAVDNPPLRQKYKDGDFFRSDKVKDLDERFRWDLYWYVLAVYDRDRTWREFTYELKDTHIDTALRKIVRPL